MSSKINTNKSKYSVNGYIETDSLPSKPNLRYNFSDMYKDKSQELPSKVDLRKHLTPVEAQLKTKSCVANAFAGAYEYLLKKATGKHVDVSRLFIYYNARVKLRGKSTVVDTGCTTTSALEALEEYGTCLEELWPFDLGILNSRPDVEAYESARSNRIVDALSVRIDLNEMKTALANGLPFVFGLKLYSSFRQAKVGGVVCKPQSDEDQKKKHGRHAMLAVGYSDKSRAFIVRNSWGPKWGDDGYCYIPYDYMADPNYCRNAWVVRSVETGDLGLEDWIDEDTVDYLATVDVYDGDSDDEDDDDWMEESDIENNQSSEGENDN